MRLTQQLLRSRTNEPLSSVQLLDLSKLELVSLERLSSCPKLRHLCLHGNSLQSINNLDHCCQLWSLDASSNNIGCLGGLSRFVALGSLILANNDLGWSELVKIRHIHILELTLSDNPRLQRDPYYRLHVIDSLPNVWMLDGKFITSAERLQVKHFFDDSALRSHPVRHKLAAARFTPTAFKNINVTGIYGEKATHLLRRFPTGGPVNIESDKRRVMYLAYNLQQELLLHRKWSKTKLSLLKFHPTFLEDLLKARTENLEQCNMLLLLLLASLEFSIPMKLMKETLITSKLDNIGGVSTIDLFLLPREIRCHVITILLNRAKVDKDIGQDGGLYPTLYQCLMYTVSELNRIRYTKRVITPVSAVQKNYKTLLASEVVQLLCIVPGFYQYIDRDEGVSSLLVAATKNPKIASEVVTLAKALKTSRASVKEIYDDVSNYILEKVEDKLHEVVSQQPAGKDSDGILSNIRALPMKQPTAIAMADFHMKGQYYPNRDPPKLVRPNQGPIHVDPMVFPHLGDRLLLGPQTVAKVVALPQPFIALVLMDAIPDANGAMVTSVKKADIHYTYVDMTEFHWNNERGVWQPKGTVGDRITIQRVEDGKHELEETGFTSLDDDLSGRPNSPVNSGDSTHKPSDRDSPRKLRSPGAPRPMSAVLKDKLKLNLDLTRRPKTAFSIHMNHTLGIQGEKVTAQSRGNNSTPRSSRYPKRQPIEIDSTQPVKNSSTNVEDSHTKVSDDDNIEHVSNHIQDELSPEDDVPKPVVKTEVDEMDIGKDEGVDELLNDMTDVVSIQSDISNTDERELQILVDSEPEDGAGKVSQPSAPIQGESTLDLVPSAVNSLQQVAISLPRAEHTESLNTSRDGSVTAEDNKGTPRSGKSPRNSVKIKTEPKVFSCLETQPISAVEAYKFVVQHPAKGYQKYQKSSRSGMRGNSAPSSRKSNTQYLHQYGNTTPQEVHSIAEKNKTEFGRSLTSLMITKMGRPRTPFNVTLANNWLAGGKDIHSENMKKRPKSSHTPGWKEGLPKKQRPKFSAVATQTSAVWDGTLQPSWIPGHLSKNGSILGDGSPRDSLLLPDLPSLSDYINSVRDGRAVS